MNTSSTTYMLRIRLTEEQRQRLEQLAKADGDVTLSNYCRKKLFESLSTELKLNKILELLNTKKAK
jgi:hypothetical protein